MSAITKNFLDFAGLSEYDSSVKAWSNTANQLGYKTVLSDGNNLYFFKKPNATDQEYAQADKTISLGGADASDKLNALAAIIDATATYDATNKVWSINLASGFAASTVVGAVNELLTDIGDVDDLDITLATGETAPADIVAAANLLNDHIDAIADTIANMDGTATIATVSNNVVTIKGGVKQIAGEIENKTTLEAADVVLEEVAVTGAAADVSIADAGNLITATNVEDALQEVAEAIEDAIDGAKVTCEESSGSGDVLKVYSFYQGVLGTDDATAKAAKKIADINIPKDYLVKSAEIKTVTVADEPYEGAQVGDKYIDFTINTKDGAGTGTAQHIYIALNDLVSVIQGSVGAEVTITIGANNTIQATINKIDATKIVYEAGTGGAADVTVKNVIDKIDGADTVTGSFRKGDADTLATAIGANTDVASANTIYGAKAYADDAVDTAINGLDTVSDIAIASVDNSGNIVLQNGISETDGVIEQGAGDGIIIAPIATADIQGLFS